MSIKIKCPNPKCNFEQTLIKNEDYTNKTAMITGRCPNCGSEIKLKMK